MEEEWPQALAEPEVGLAGILPVHAATIAAAVDQIGRQLGRAVGPEDFEPSTWAQAELGRGFSAPQLVTAREVVVAWSRRVTGWWAGGFDLLLLPTLGTAPPALGAMRWDGGRDRAEVMATVVAFGAYCPAFNWTGQPAITLPVGTDADGMPVGVQLVAAYGREDLLLRVAARVEEARPWSGRRPRVHA
ncbi:MAG: amidase family protein [Acidimicrobiia bacterium]|nr:amidase family protein [Acidimicrobiia bacterium]